METKEKKVQEEVDLSRRRFLKATVTGAVIAGLALSGAVTHAYHIPFVSPEHIIEHNDVERLKLEKLPYAIVVKSGSEAVAISLKGELIARSTYHGYVINRAIQYLYEKYGCGVVKLGIGTFIIEEPIVLPKNIHFVGSGRRCTILKQADGANLDAIIKTTDELHYWCPVIAHLQIDGNKKNNTNGKGIVLYGCHQSLIFEVGIENVPGSGIYVTKTSDGASTLQLSIVKVQIVRSEGWGIELRLGAHDCEIRDCSIGENTVGGIYVGSSSTCVIAFNGIWNNGDRNIELIVTSYCRVIGNEISNSNIGIRLGAGAKWCVIVGNRFFTCKTGAEIYSSDSTNPAERNLVYGNIFLDCENYGVHESGYADYNVFFGNMFDNVPTPYSVAGLHTYCDGKIYDKASLPTDGFALPNVPIVALDSSTGTYYLCSFIKDIGWRCVTLS